MKRSELVSVIIPAFNAALYVRRAVESVLAQTHEPVEVIVVDDGSKDETSDVLRDFGNKILLISQNNRGPASARNAALRVAQGQFVMFLDADDWILPQKLKKQVGLLTNLTHAGWAYCDIAYVTDNGEKLYLASDRFSYAKRKKLEGLLFSELILGNFIPIHAPLIRRECIDSVGHFDEDVHLIGVEDWDLLLRLASRFETIYVPDILANCVIHSGSLSADPAERDRRRFDLLDKVIVRFYEQIRSLGSPGDRLIADTHNWFAIRHYRLGFWKESRKRFEASLRVWPWQRKAWLYLISDYAKLIMRKCV